MSETMPHLTPVEEADERIHSLVSTAPYVNCPIEKCAGRTLREKILADRDSPPFNRSMMDGFAIRFQDLARDTRFHVKYRLPAGETPANIELKPSEAVEIMTGAMTPEYTDTVIPYEETSGTRNDNTFTVTEPEFVKKGQCIHSRGADEQAGNKVLEPGIRIGPVEAGIIASCGLAHVQVSQQPRISIFSTGDELVAVESKPDLTQIRGSNRHAIEVALALSFFSARHLDHFPDQAAIIEQKLIENLPHNDVMIITGGISRGHYDYVAPILDHLTTRVCHGISQKPGKPMGVWKAESGCVIFGLPGNPVSALVCLHRYVLPFLRLRDGNGRNPHISTAKLTEEVTFDRPLTWYLPVKEVEPGWVQPCPPNNSGDFMSLRNSDGFIQLEANISHWNQGDVKPFYYWLR